MIRSAVATPTLVGDDVTDSAEWNATYACCPAREILRAMMAVNSW